MIIFGRWDLVGECLQVETASSVNLNHVLMRQQMGVDISINGPDYLTDIKFRAHILNGRLYGIEFDGLMQALT